jgi:hypothetical protein
LLFASSMSSPILLAMRPLSADLDGAFSTIMITFLQLLVLAKGIHSS